MNAEMARLTKTERVTTDAIFAASDDAKEILAAADVVFGEVESLNDAAKKAIAAHDTAVDRLGAARGTPYFADCHAAARDASERAIEATRALQKAWDRYQPWREALDRIEQTGRLSAPTADRSHPGPWPT